MFDGSGWSHHLAIAVFTQVTPDAGAGARRRRAVGEERAVQRARWPAEVEGARARALRALAAVLAAGLSRLLVR